MFKAVVVLLIRRKNEKEKPIKKVGFLGTIKPVAHSNMNPLFSMNGLHFSMKAKQSIPF